MEILEECFSVEQYVVILHYSTLVSSVSCTSFATIALIFL